MRRLLSLSLILALFLVGNSCKTKQKVDLTQLDYIPDRIIVLLKPKAKPYDMMNAMAEYELTNKGMVSRSENRMMFTYNMEKIKPEEMLAKIKAHDNVLEAAFAPKAPSN